MSEDATERLTLLLQARDKDFQRAMERNNRAIERLSRDATRNTKKMTSSIDRALNGVSKKMGNFAKGVLGGLVAGALAGITSNVTEVLTRIAAIGDEARRAGLGNTVFQELSFAAEQSRIPVDALIDGIKELNLRGDEFAATGGGSAAEAFDRLGFSASDVRRQLEEPAEFMLTIIDRLERMDEAAQIRLADEVFGGSGGEQFVQLIAQGDEGIRQLMERAHEVGAVMDDEMIEKAAELDRRFGEVKATVSGLFRTMVVEGVDAFSQLREAMRPTLDEIERSAATFDRLSAAGIDGTALIETDNLEAVADEAEAVASAYDDMASAATRASAEMSQQAFELGNLGYADQALDLIRLSDEMLVLAAALRDGTGDSAALSEQLGTVASEALAAAEAAAEINGVSMATVIGRLRAVAGTLDVVRRVAITAREAIANAVQARSAATPSVGRVASQEGRSGDVILPPPPPTYPSGAMRPAPRPADIDFGYTPSDAGGGGGGGGGGGAAREVRVRARGDGDPRADRCPDTRGGGIDRGGGGRPGDGRCHRLRPSSRRAADSRAGRRARDHARTAGRSRRAGARLRYRRRRGRSRGGPDRRDARQRGPWCRCGD